MLSAATQSPMHVSIIHKSNVMHEVTFADRHRNELRHIIRRFVSFIYTFYVASFISLDHIIVTMYTI